MRRSTPHRLLRPWAVTALAALALLASTASAGAQDSPAGQSCGGLLCDIGVLGHKNAPAAPAGTPVPAPVSTPVPPPEALLPAARATAVVKPRRHVAARRALPHPPKLAAAPSREPPRAPPVAELAFEPPPPPVAASVAPPPQFMFRSIDPALTLYR